MKNRILVTSYKNPDLDGTACAFAYSEYLQKNGKDSVASVFGNPHREAQFVLKKFNIPALENADKIIDDIEKIVIVDASDLRGLSDKIDPQKVIEIIDHRKINEADKFINAKKQIEFVGSAATLVAEKFYKSKVSISKESAAALFSAIASNTIDFQANVTTKRDRKMADWLKTKFGVPENYVHEMFTEKSKFRKPLKETLLDDFATFDFGGKHLGIAQLEIINVDIFVKENLENVRKALSDLKIEKSLDLIFLNCIDVEKVFNTITVIDKNTEKLVESALKIRFDNGMAKTPKIIMRKEIVPLVKTVLETTD